MSVILRQGVDFREKRWKCCLLFSSLRMLMYFKQHVSLEPERCKFIHFFAASRISRKSLFTIFGFGELGTYLLRLSFAVCRIHGVSLISALKEDFHCGLCFMQYRINLRSPANWWYEHIIYTYNFRSTSKLHTW